MTPRDFIREAGYLDGGSPQLLLRVRGTPLVGDCERLGALLK